MNNKSTNRPANMSQLDYLWSNFGSYSVANSLETPNSIPTTDAVKDYIQQSEEGIIELKAELLDNEYQIRIIGIDGKGREVTSIRLEQDTKITSFVRHYITQEDLDNGIGSKLGELGILLTTSRNETFFISINDFIYLGQETDTIITQVVNSRIASELKIDNPIVNKTVHLTATPNGLKADLVINPNSNSNVYLVKSNDGVEAKFVWNDTDTPVGFKSITFDEYKLSTPKAGIVYFITDDPAIYFNGTKFTSVGIDPNQYATKDDLKYAVLKEQDRAELAEQELGESIQQEAETREQNDEEITNIFNFINV